MAEKKSVVRAVEPKVPVEWKSKICPVVSYIPQYGILGFTFDGVPCQITVGKNLDIRSEVNIRYLGDIKTGIEFKL